MPAVPLQEEKVWHGTPSARVLLGQVTGLVLVVIILPLLARYLSGTTADLDQSARIMNIGWLVTAAIVLLMLIRLGISLMRIRSTLYTITNQRIVVERGILTKSVSEIDLRTIDDTQFFQSPTQRLLGIGDVTLISTDKSTPVYVLRALPDPRTMRETIRSHAYRVSQRQLFTRQA